MLAMYLLGILVAIVVAFILKRTVLKAAAAVHNGTAAVSPAEPSNCFSKHADAGVAVRETCGNGDPCDLDHPLGVDVFPEKRCYRAANAGPLQSHHRSRMSTSSCRLRSRQLRNSYAGSLGHTIEPVIRPLGFDWKIGVALIASFAARRFWFRH